MINLLSRACLCHQQTNVLILLVLLFSCLELSLLTLCSLFAFVQLFREQNFPFSGLHLHLQILNYQVVWVGGLTGDLNAALLFSCRYQKVALAKEVFNDDEVLSDWSEFIELYFVIIVVQQNSGKFTLSFDVCHSFYVLAIGIVPAAKKISLWSLTSLAHHRLFVLLLSQQSNIQFEIVQFVLKTFGLNKSCQVIWNGFKSGETK